MELDVLFTLDNINLCTCMINSICIFEYAHILLHMLKYLNIFNKVINICTEEKINMENKQKHDSLKYQQHNMDNNCLEK